jgi:uncharacterized membrane protein
VLTGAAMLITAYTGRRRLMNTVGGIGLVARGLSGYCPVNSALGRTRTRALDDTREALGGDRGVLIEDSVTVWRPASELYSFWRRLENLPEVFSHLSKVETSGRMSHWVMAGPVGTKFEWDAEIINDVKPDLIGWRSLPGSDIASAGSVSFREGGRRGLEFTDVTVRMQYNAPGGKAARALAWLSGIEPATVVREELQRFKQRFESGEVSIPA